MKSLILLPLLGLILTPLAAQIAVSKLPPLPAGPLPANLEHAQWTVTIDPDSGGNNAPSKSPPINRTIIRITKDGKLRQIVIQDPDNQTTTYWCVKGAQYYQQRDESWVQVDPVNGMLISSYAGSDFPECKSVSRQNYSSTIKVDGRPCFVFSGVAPSISAAQLADFQQNAAPGQTIAASQFMAEDQVDLDMATALPLKTHFNNQIYTYQYSPSAPSLTIPPTLLYMINVHQQRLDDLNRTPAHA